MNDRMKMALNKTYDLFNIIDQKAQIMKKANAKGELSSIFKFELMSFLICLSASDGRISRVEAKLIRDCFDVEMYPGDLKNFMIENDIGSKKYYKKIPQSLKIAVAIDNYIYNTGDRLSESISEIVIELFKVMGKEMVVADEKVKAEEQMAWSKYITMMTQYMVDHLEEYRQRNDTILRPGESIEVDYEMSLEKIGRIYTLYMGKL